jgi:hypothetical protein
MKTIFTLLFFMMYCTVVHAQLNGQIRVGWACKSNQPILAPSFNYSFGGFAAGTEMVINTNEDAPVDFGFRASYTYKFIEAGVAGYYELYSTDEYDAYKNGWAKSVFVAAHLDRYFIQYDYLHGNRFTFGMCVKLTNR